MIQTPEYLADIQERIYQLQEVLEDTGLDAHDTAEIQSLTTEYNSLN